MTSNFYFDYYNIAAWFSNQDDGNILYEYQYPDGSVLFIEAYIYTSYTSEGGDYISPPETIHSLESFEVTDVTFCNPDGDIDMAIGSSFDITQLEKAIKEFYDHDSRYY